MIVYYTTKLNQFSCEPEPLLSSFFSKYNNNSDQINQIRKCPSVTELLYNCFVIKNFLTYDISWDGSSYSSKYYNQKFFDDHVNSRDPSIGLLSYRQPNLRFFCEDSLEITALSPFMHDVDLKRKAIFIPGKYNIGKHFRPLEVPFIFLEKNSKITFKESEPLFYIKFHTDEKIQFKPFLYTEELYSLETAILSVRNGVNVKSLSFFYNLVTKNYKKKILQIIKKNLM